MMNDRAKSPSQIQNAFHLVLVERIKGKKSSLQLRSLLKSFLVCLTRKLNIN